MAFSFRAGTNWCHDFPKLARESGFCFNVHRTRVRVDWNRISSIDIDRVIRERDFLTVDDNVNNVVDYSLESEYDVKILDPNFVKLFRLAQLSVEYLLYCKQYLDHSVIILKDELRLKIEDNAILKREIETLENTIKELTQKMKDRNRIIEAKLGDSNGELFKCPHCTKTFIGQKFLSAHIARRHPHLPDPYTMQTFSPMHDQYRAETEKLHDEIKTLKERLNQTERVIRNESEKTMNCIKTDISYRALDTSEKGEYTSDKEREEKFQDQQKKYQDEIASLKSMLFTEIKNLKQKDVGVSSIHQIENDTNIINLKELIKKQEKEINTLRDQLREKLTPDLKDIQEKLQMQEEHWKVVNERLEAQHNLDTENLSTQLKLSQEAAKEMKELYESKINDLEMHSISQKKMLETQSVQLKHLSRELFESRDVRETMIDSRNESPGRSTINKGQSIKNVNNSRQINSRNTKQGELVYEEVEDVSSHESPKMLVSAKQNSTKYISRREYRTDPLSGSGDFETSEDTEGVKMISERVTPVTSCKKPREKKDLNIKNDKRTSVENFRLESVRSSQSEKIMRQSLQKNPYRDSVQAFRGDTGNRIQRSRKHLLYMNNPNSEASRTVGRAQNVNHNPQTSVQNAKTDRSSHSHNKTESEKKIPYDKFSSRLSPQKSIEESEDSEDYSETESESSISNSDSQTVPDNEETDKITTNSRYSESPNSRESIKEMLQRNPDVLEELNLHLGEVFDKKLKDLGIDPEWNGIPDATFKQKMETVARHRSINSKKISGYDRIRQRILKQISQALSKKKYELGNSEKISPLNRIMSKVRSKTTEVLRRQKSFESRKPIVKLQLVTPRDKIPRPTSSLEILPKKMKESDINEMRNNKTTESLQRREPESQSNIQAISVRNREIPSRIKSGNLNRRHNVEIVNHNEVTDEQEDSTSLEQLSQSRDDIEYLSENNSVSNATKFTSQAKSTKVTSTLNKSVEDIVEQSYLSADDESENNLITEERARSLPASPKNNKSVLKSTTGSVGSLVKKKVLFDLEQSLENNEKSPDENTAAGNWSSKKLFPEYDSKSAEVKNDNWNISDMSNDDSCSPHKEKSPSVENIVLKTSQSDRIAKISQKIQDQLSIVRQKPVGAIEAMFLVKPGAKVNDKDNTQYRSSTSIASSILESPKKEFLTKESVKTDRFPIPAQRTSKIHESDIESDIEELLQMG